MLKLTNISKIYSTADSLVKALDDVSICFNKNEFVSILGPSGCGKTTLLNIIGGLDRYTKGDLTIDGISTKNYNDRDWDTYRNSSIGFVFQSYNLIPHQTVLENVELALTLSGISKAERVKRAKDALDSVGLLGQCNKKPNQLSGGQMQRVAIARALVNDPKIVLADEPTGALDSSTSIAVMDLLKNVAKDRLVIMVTHNAELAQKYSTRIINLLDGKVIGDSKPYLPNEQDDKKEKPKRKSAMSWFTSLKLSLKNLISKRARTFLTSFAGSIGIVGIALVLAVSNGFNIYIGNMQQGTLASYPLTIYSSILDTNSLLSGNTNHEQGSGKDEYLPIEETGITVSGQMTASTITSAQHPNKLDDTYINYIKNNVSSDLYTAISYNYGINQNLFMQSGFDGQVRKLAVPLYSMEEMMVNMDMSKFVKYAESYSASYSSINWKELLSNSDFLQNNYDTLNGKFPTSYNEVALVVNKKNQVSRAVLQAMGFTDEQIEKGFTSSDFVGKTLKLVPNDEMFTTSTMTTPYGDLLNINPVSEDQYEEIYKSDKAITVKITSVIRVNKEGNDIYNSGIVYLPSLTTKLKTSEQNSTLKDKFNSAKIVIFNNGSVPTIASSDGTKSFDMGTNTITTNDTWDSVSKLLGLSDNPQSISIYAVDFDTKTEIIKILNDFNNGKEKADQVIFSDTTSLITSSMSSVVNAISIVLNVFASISLVVSSIMIGIITYVSVVERTREIGVLRSLGARKRDISNLFEAETFIIGLLAGLLGIGISYLLTLLINVIVVNIPSISIANLAQLNPLHALALVAISFILTMIAGLIPSRIAAKKDPVVALRTE